MVLIIGSYASAVEPGIHIYQLDSVNLSPQPLYQISGINNPSFLTLSADGHKLFALSEDKKGNLGQINLFSLKDLKKSPGLRARIHFKAAGSCHLSMDRASRHVFVSNYGDGSLMVFKRISSAKETPVSTLIKFAGHGPDSRCQAGPHLGAALLTPDERFLYCTDLGSDRIYRFGYDAKAELPLSPADPDFVALPPGSGPRHIAITSDSKNLYLISELSCEIFGFDIRNGFSSWFQQISLREAGCTGKSEAGDIQIHPSGKFLYVTRRGDINEVIVLEINPENGGLAVLQRKSSNGKGPRSLAISQNGELLVTANESSGDIAFFNIDPQGRLSDAGARVKVSRPSCVQLLSVKP
jgi:6-phosphogluconolactonase